MSARGNYAPQRPVKILRDTEASQSLMLESILPQSERLTTGTSVWLQGLGGCVKAPLQVVNLESDLVSAPVLVGIHPTLPMEGVSFIIGNDLAGDKVLVNPP